MNRVYYSEEPQPLLRLGDGSWLYRWDIQGEETEDGTRWSCLQVRLHTTPTADSVTKAAISAMWPPDIEAKLINDYNAAAAGLLTEAKAAPYRIYLSERAALKRQIAEHFDAPFDAAPAVPATVSKFRFWLAFYGATGLSNRDVEAVISSWDSGPQKAEALIALDSARDYRRGNSFVDLLRVEAGLTEEQMDAVFIAASQLEVD